MKGWILAGGGGLSVTFGVNLDADNYCGGPILISSM